MIKIKNLHIFYDQLDLLSKDELRFYPGLITGIYGKSGCGKSSLLDFLNLEKDFGQIYVDDQLVNDLSDDKKQIFKFNTITYISQKHVFIPGLTCKEILEFALSTNHTNKNYEELCNEANLRIGNDTTIDQLSMGQRAIFGLVYAMLKDDQIILLDEIFSSLDKETIKHLFKLLHNLKQQGMIYTGTLALV